MPARGLLLTKDLFFGSKVTGTATALGGAIDMAASQSGALERIAKTAYGVILVDLQAAGLDLAELCRVADGIPVIAFGPHVATEAFAAAEAAGCREVLPRSRFSAQLPQLLSGWLNLS